MIDVGKTVSENIRRLEAKNSPYNPVTGENCYGKRVRLAVEDAPLPVLYLPERMLEMKACRDLLEYGSIGKVFSLVHGISPGREDIDDFWIDFCEMRCRYDFEYYCIYQIQIRDKRSAANIPFRLNRPQREYLLPVLEEMRNAGQPIRFNYLKSRQVGGSTLIQIYMNWIQVIHRENWNSVVCAHVRDAAVRIRAMYERAVEKMLPAGGIKYSIRDYKRTQNIKHIPERGCLITTGTALEPDSVRSDDVKMVHLSEMAYYPNTDNNNPELMEASILSSIPEDDCTLVCRETTANGSGDYFYEQWERAKRGETVFRNIFIPWYVSETYEKAFDGFYHNRSGKREAGSVEDFIRSMSEYEINTFNNHPGCTLENLNWRRLKAASMSGERIMKQEFPVDDIEAFQDSGNPAFRSEDVEALRKKCRPPQAIGVLVSDCPASSAKTETGRRKAILSGIHFAAYADATEDYASPNPAWRERAERDRLKIWEFPDTGKRVSNRYVAVFDPQKGISDSADWGVIAVFDRYWMMYGGVPEIVAEWRGRTDKDIAVWIAAQTAKYYCNALLVVESNTYDSEYREDDSEFIFDTIAGYYGNLYSRTPADKIREGIPAKYGFNTNRSTKPMIIGGYVSMLREKGYIERNAEALNEARVYERKQNGSFGAKPKKHDDILMTRMIGCHICYELPLPAHIKMETSPAAKKQHVNESSFF